MKTLFTICGLLLCVAVQAATTNLPGIRNPVGVTPTTNAPGSATPPAPSETFKTFLLNSDLSLPSANAGFFKSNSGSLKEAADAVGINASQLGGRVPSAYASTNNASRTNAGLISSNMWRTLHPIHGINYTKERVPWGAVATWITHGANLDEEDCLNALTNMLRYNAKAWGYKYFAISEPPWNGTNSDGLLTIDTNKFPLHGMRPLEWLCKQFLTNGIKLEFSLYLQGQSPAGYTGLYFTDAYKNVTNWINMGVDNFFSENYETPSAGMEFLERYQDLIGQVQRAGFNCVWQQSSYEWHPWTAGLLQMHNPTHQLADSSGSWDGFIHRLDKRKGLREWIGPGHYIYMAPWYTPYLSNSRGLHNYDSYKSQIIANIMLCSIRGEIDMFNMWNRYWTGLDGYTQYAPTDPVITNTYLSDVNYDDLVVPGLMTRSNNNVEVWIRPLEKFHGTKKAVWVLNRSTNNSASDAIFFTNVFPRISSKTPVSVFDPWFPTWLGYRTNSLPVSLPPMGSAFYVLQYGKEAGWPSGTNYLLSYGPLGNWGYKTTNATFQTSEPVASIERGWNYNGRAGYNASTLAIFQPGYNSRGSNFLGIVVTNGSAISGTNYFDNGIGLSSNASLEWNVTGATNFHCIWGYNEDIPFGHNGGSWTVKTNGTAAFTQATVFAGKLITNDIPCWGVTNVSVELTKASATWGNLVDVYIVVP